MGSLRPTLVLRLSATLLGTLLILGTITFLDTRKAHFDELDRSLIAASALQQTGLGRVAPLKPNLTWLAHDQFVDSINRFIVVRDRRGTAIDWNTPLAADLPFDELASSTALSGKPTLTTSAWRGGKIRSLYAAKRMHDSSAVRVIQVSASTLPIETRLKSTLWIWLGAMVVATSVTAVGSSLVVTTSMAPVAEITAQAEAIPTGSLGRRIAIRRGSVEFRGLVNVMNALLERQDHALVAERRILADAGHDLRTPLTAMRGEIEVTLRSRRTEDEYRAVLNSQLEEVDRLSSISEAMVSLARIESGDQRPKHVMTDLAELCADAVDRIQRRAGDSHAYHFKRPADSTCVAADPGLIALLLDHLLDNTVRHTPPGTQTTVNITDEPDTVTLSIADNGPGVATTALPYIFDRFFRADESRGRGAGAGLGLTISSAIVAAHEGSIRVDCPAPHGFAVHIELPKRRPDLPAPSALT